MSTLTSIEWTDVTWNPVRGCSLVSAGCANCYAMKQAHRFSGAGKPYEGLTELGPQGPRWTGKIQLVEDVLDAPLHWRIPRRIFVNSMSDLFHEDVPDQFIDKVFAVMLCSPRHTFQILTKRPQRMLDYMMTDNGFGRSGHIWNAAYKVPGIHVPKGKTPPPFPYPHVWLGVSIEDQATADERIPILLATPAAVRWVSAEPLLGPVDLSTMGNATNLGEGQPWLHPLDGLVGDGHGDACAVNKLDWVVVGGESGPGARPCDIGHIRTIVQQCRAAGVPCFVKQLGSRPFVVEGSRAAQEWSALGASAVMDDCGGIHTKDQKGGDMAEWTADLCVREWPR